eukprot:5792718-Amphidinium_carterae.1
MTINSECFDFLGHSLSHKLKHLRKSRASRPEKSCNFKRCDSNQTPRLQHQKGKATSSLKA